MRHCNSIAIPLLALALGACNVTSAALTPAIEPSGPPPTASLSDAELFKRARTAVVANLKDPDSVRFGSKFERLKHATRAGEPYEIVCGQVNARNSFGGYTGMTVFAWTSNDNEVSTIPLITENLCLGKTGSTPSRGT